MRRYARKTDSTQREIAKGLRKCGFEVQIIHEPVDLAVTRPGSNWWRLMECKPLTGKRKPKARVRTDQPEQNQFCDAHGVPRVTSIEHALAYVGGQWPDWSERKASGKP